MKLNLPAVLMIFGGSLLIYSAAKKEDPRNVIFEALGVKQRVSNFYLVPGQNLGSGQLRKVTPGTSAPVAVPGQKVVTV